MTPSEQGQGQNAHLEYRVIVGVHRVFEDRKHAGGVLFEIIFGKYHFLGKLTLTASNSVMLYGIYTLL